uniref:Uncharacterized protein n=1 Tax=Periophthalmus magnuspinnatus TaxID=409849 RepID=A0A3B3ZZV6_9GOBI
MERGGNYNMNAIQHTGTFAQEIITLTHLVKDLYFRGKDITLNERFSAPQKVGYDDEEPHEITLSERFGSNRYKPAPIYLGLLGSSLVRDPDDLRHDLEKRRQERLEGVKVTIAGQTQPHHKEELMEEAEFSNWSEKSQRRQEGTTVRN